MEQPNFMLALQGFFWLVAIFVGLRWLLLWYFKINHQAHLQEETVALLRSINERMGGEPVVMPEKKVLPFSVLPVLPKSIQAAKEHYFGRVRRD